MPLTVYSPHSGQPVKIRDQDIERAVRDQEGRIFYVVPRSDGNGYYASITRKGSEKDEQRYLQLEQKSAVAKDQSRSEQAAAQAPAAHDATGRRRRGGLGGLLIKLVILAALVAGGYYAYVTYINPDAPSPGELLQDDNAPGSAGTDPSGTPRP